MLKKYLAKFAMDILPSVAATIIGAYIVNHYIVTKPATDTPVAAAMSLADPKKSDSKNDAKPSETSADVASIPEAGVKAKGISEKAVLEKSAVEKPQSGEKPAETASIPVEPRRHQPGLREKAVVQTVPPAAPAVAPVVATPVEAATAPDDHRDANDLARAAIERLRSTGEGPPRTQEAARAPAAARLPDAARIPDTPRVVSAPVVTPVRPLPPPIMVSTPAGETFDQATGSLQIKPPRGGAVRIDDPSRPTPPADIPPSQRPLDLHAEAAAAPTRDHTSVAQDMLSAAKSVFHAVLPK
jgi:hypothetical protein